MSRLETTLWELYLRGDPRISVLESFQSAPYTYVKVFVDDGTHGITVQEITSYPFPFCNNEDAALNKDEALNGAVLSALKKVADLITERVLISTIKSFTADGDFTQGPWHTRDINCDPV